MTPTQSMIEAVAKAMAAFNNEKWDASDFNETASGCEPEDARHGWRGNAQAALSAFLAQAEVEGWEMTRKEP